ncbi:MAG TPA: hypothetical protein VFP87_09725 [Chitinophagaceae bacterium]|nr:hypothetical protein [Chitinophagaceae bacterium]
MRSTVSILLLSLLTFTLTPLGEVVKLPVLIQHYYMHKQQDSISLLGFLKDHYSTRHKDADQSQDEQLPFRTVAVQGIGFALVPAMVRTSFVPRQELIKKVAVGDSILPKQHLCSIFHPPRA